MSNYQYELAYRKYVAAFDGTNNLSPAEFKTLFDNVYHKDLVFIPSEDKLRCTPMTREERFQSHFKSYTSGTKATLIHFRKVGLDCVDLKVRLVNGDEETTVRVVVTISGGRAIRCKEIDESIPIQQVLEASCVSAWHKWNEMYTYQTIM